MKEENRSTSVSPSLLWGKTIVILLVVLLIFGVFYWVPEKKAERSTIPQEAQLPGDTRQSYQPFPELEPTQRDQ